MPDLEPPRATSPTLIVHPLTGVVVNYLGDPMELHAVWGFDDLESGLQWVRGGLSLSATPPARLPLTFPIDPGARRGIVSLAPVQHELNHSKTIFFHM